MQKKGIFHVQRHLGDFLSHKKWLLIMRTSTLVLFGVLLSANMLMADPARAQDASDKIISIEVTGITFSELFHSIEMKTGVIIMYENTKGLLNSTVTISARNETIGNVLTRVLKGKPLKWISREDIIRIEDASDTIANKAGRLGMPLIPSLLTTPPVTGIVRGPDGQSLIGANIIIKGTKRGTTSGIDGSFSIEAKNGDVIIISSIGFTDRQIIINNNNIGVISLTASESKLDEVQVIAYGVTTKRLNTGNVGTVKASDIEKQPVSNPLLALQGRVPGLLISQNNGLPGGGISIRIQGQNSIGKGNDPLYVIDGVPFSSQMLATVSGGPLGRSGVDGENLTTLASGGNPLSYINPADIESIDVLKDADATAIYGSRAANGAILITMKKGKAGKTSMNVNLQKGFGKATRRIDLLNTKEYIMMRKEALKNDNRIASADPFSPDYAADLTIYDTTRDTDWQDVLIGGAAQYTDLQTGVSGGNAATQYLLNAGYHKETTVFPGNFSDQKGSLHFNISSVSPNQKFRMQTSGSYMIDNNRLPSDDYTQTALLLVPNAPSLYNADGTLNWAPNSAGRSTWANPIAGMERHYYNKTKNLTANTNLSYEFFKELIFKVNLGYVDLNTDEFSGSPITAFKPERRATERRSASYNNSQLNSWIIEPQLSYKTRLAGGTMDILIGGTFLNNIGKGQCIFGSGYSSDQSLEDLRAATDVDITQSLISVYKYNAAFGRLNYNWENKYIINLSARRDGSSRFGSENLFHNFASIGAAWLFTQEKFMQQLSLLSFGKLRGSFGTTGNDQIGDYQFMNLYDNITPEVSFQGGGSITATGHNNPYLQWEETRKLQVGIDLGFIGDKILFGAGFAHNSSSNQLLSYALPIVTGFGDVTRNFPATVQNTSWEFTLSTVNIRSKNFSWNTNMNLTIPKNKLVAFDNLSTSTYANFLTIGKPLSIFKVYPFAGVNPLTGVFQVYDQKGNATETPDGAIDKTVFMDLNPVFYGGMQNAFSYKEFQLDLFLQFVKQKARSMRFGSNVSLHPGYYNNPTATGNHPAAVLDRWQKPGDIATSQRFNSTFDLLGSLWNAFDSDAAFADASYMRLKNISLSWNLPSQWQKVLHTEKARLFIQGQNLLTFTSYNGVDPENKSLNSLPPLKVLTFGIQLGL